MDLVMNTIDIVVTDMEASIAFYRRLGVEFKVDASYPDHAGADLPGGLHLMLDTESFRASITPGWTRPSGGARTFLSFQAPAPGDVAAKYDELVAAGYQGIKEPWDAFWGMRTATVADPDGNGIDLYCPLPAT
ncbi:VOC family protein [Thermomonospora umbrina]|uniref:Putative lactoylglutathione lyase n=1 Tax=Thermomonospora umbrina TaxID=111806 RepID=A0A3D9SX16_9ACTN|nr:VOC family protein [Thermomonospora umbrina]REF00503.1 putative lactoylglutathione lyase [Thermomonospora umbrina]